MALLSMRDVSIGFGGALVLEDINLQIERGERLGLLGRNGVGKSTLLKIIAGEITADEGTISRQQGLRVAYLAQEVPQGLRGTVAEVVAGGLEPVSPVAEEMAGGLEPGGLEAGDDEETWRRRLQLDTTLSRMQLDPSADFEPLSAGLKRRVLLARGLVRDPDIVLLDEPTNHLDIESIAWLEDFLLRYDGTLVFVTHDRIFLRRLATRIVEIDRGAADRLVLRLRHLYRTQTGAPGGRNHPGDRVRQEAGPGRGLDPARHRGAPDAQRGPRARAGTAARRAPGAPRAARARCACAIQEAERSGKLVIEAKNAQL